MFQHASDNSARVNRCMRRDIRESSARSRERKCAGIERELERVRAEVTSGTDRAENGAENVRGDR